MPSIAGRRISTFAAAALVALLSAQAHGAEPLAKSGSINVRSGYWAVGDVVTVGDKHQQGHGNNRGIIFNEKGSGPFHLGPTDCFYVLDIAGDKTKVRGYCTFGDTDGDKVWSEFDGASQAGGDIGGMHTITGGSGKFAGITGTIPWRCKFAGGNGELECTQRIDYKLP